MTPAAAPGFTLFDLGFPWRTRDPFLFCVHHLDGYPKGNERLGPPAASLSGRNLGMDFEGRDGWRMYHGQEVPGFPYHPHRGFETVTLARRGFIDHSDSLGAKARFGQGDVQWMTAGKGIVHSEMFPLLERDAPNPVELFQIWLNLPGRDKMADPHFAMLWSDRIPTETIADASGRKSEIVAVSGRLGSSAPPAPPPRSWAADPEHEVAIWTIRMEAGAVLELPAATHPAVNRTLYFFAGERVRIDDHWLTAHAGCDFLRARAARLENGPTPSELLLLQGLPIGEPVVQHGPFVMNTPNEIYQAISDYQRTQFGGWPWPSSEPVHPRDAGRFARHADGREENAQDRGTDD
ncbi:MAG: pirin family protein [Deltaproteobacteria bacterium]|nr:pirin family protein [Deltaproteobacteria bacterium]